jgi:hypothetical protein
MSVPTPSDMIITEVPNFTQKEKELCHIGCVYNLVYSKRHAPKVGIPRAEIVGAPLLEDIL